MMLAVPAAGLFYLLLASQLGRLAAHFPAAGGGSLFAEAGLGRRGGAIASALVLVEFSTASAIVAIWTSAYLSTFVEVHPVAIILVLHGAAGVVHWRGMDLALRVTATLAVVALLGLTAFVTSVLLSAGPAWPSASGPLLPKGWSGVWSSLPFALTGFLAVEAVPLAAGEIETPERHIPPAVLAAVLVLGGFIVSVILAASAVAGPAELAATDAPLALALSAAGPSVPPWIIAVVGAAAVVAMLVGFFAMIFATSRQLHFVGEQGYAAAVLASANRWGAPGNAIVLSLLVSLVLSLSFRSDDLVVAMVLSAVLSYAAFSLAYWNLLPRLGPVPRWSRCGAAGVIGLSVALAISCFSSRPGSAASALAGAALLSTSFAFGGARPRAQPLDRTIV